MLVLCDQPLQPLDGGGGLLLQVADVGLVLLLLLFKLAALHHKGVEQKHQGGGKEDGDVLKDRPLAAALLAFPLYPWIKSRIERMGDGIRTATAVVSMAGYVLLFLVTVAFLVNDTYNPFLYFRF